MAGKKKIGITLEEAAEKQTKLSALFTNLNKTYDSLKKLESFELGDELIEITIRQDKINFTAKTREIVEPFLTSAKGRLNEVKKQLEAEITAIFEIVDPKE